MELATDRPAAPKEGQQQLHQYITIFNRLQCFPLVTHILQTAVINYTREKNASSFPVQTTLVAAEILIKKATTLALLSMEGDQVLLTADRLACSALDWTFNENIARNTDLIMQFFMNYFATVKDEFFARIRYFIDVLVPTSYNLRSCTCILLDTFCLAINSCIVLIFPSLGNVQNSIQDIFASYLQIPQRIGCLINCLSVFDRVELIMAVYRTLEQEIHIADAARNLGEANLLGQPRQHLHLNRKEGREKNSGKN